MQLAKWQDRFESVGVKVAGMTYDSQEILADFAGTEDLGYPLLRDENSEHFNAFGIRNIEYEADSRFYGIPYPGIVLISASGEVLAKFAEPGYKARPELDAVYADVVRAVGAEVGAEVGSTIDSINDKQKDRGIAGD